MAFGNNYNSIKPETIVAANAVDFTYVYMDSSTGAAPFPSWTGIINSMVVSGGTDSSVLTIWDGYQIRNLTLGNGFVGSMSLIGCGLTAFALDGLNLIFILNISNNSIVSSTIDLSNRMVATAFDFNCSGNVGITNILGLENTSIVNNGTGSVNAANCGISQAQITSIVDSVYDNINTENPPASGSLLLDGNAAPTAGTITKLQALVATYGFTVSYTGQ